MKVTLDDIYAAEKVIRPYITHTLLDFSRSCTNMAGFDVYLKFENFQQTGSFKIRGAANKLSSLTESEKKKGVIAASAGNHAQGLACVAQKLGIKATIVMPETSPLIKVISTRRFGPELILQGTNYDEAYAHALSLQQAHGYTFIHPFEDEKVIAGQGTLGLEIFKDLPDVDTVFLSIGGGGFLSGIATALKSLNPKIRIVGVQAQGADSMARSFQEKKVLLAPAMVSTIADGIAVKKPSAQMYEDFISKLCDDVITVTDDEIARAIVFLMERAKVVVEGAGAAALAGLFAKKIKFTPRKAVVGLSGGNIDLNLLESIIDRGLQAAGRISKITVAAPDIPGTLNRMTNLIADRRANILDVTHNRVSDRIGLRETLIEFTLETTGREQIEEIKAGMLNLGAKLID